MTPAPPRPGRKPRTPTGAAKPRTPIVAAKMSSGAYAHGYSQPNASTPQAIRHTVERENHRMTAYRMPDGPGVKRRER